jgi:phosphotransferase system  glucose/maltose/N-acetylglucosamine-specific IIC component
MEVVFMMFAFLLFAVLGAIIVVFGVNNIIAPLVWFNKAEVAEENKTVFGKLIGTAKIIGGIGILLFSVMAFIDISTTKPALFMIGLYLMIGMLAVALCIYVFAMIKYYKKNC